MGTKEEFFNLKPSKSWPWKYFISDAKTVKIKSFLLYVMMPIHLHLVHSIKQHKQFFIFIVSTKSLWFHEYINQVQLVIHLVLNNKLSHLISWIICNPNFLKKKKQNISPINNFTNKVEANIDMIGLKVIGSLFP